MQFFAVVSLLAATALALPPATGVTGGQVPDVHPVFDNANQYTLSQAQNKCGDKTTLSCCNHVSSVGDTTSVNYGLLNGLLGNTLSGPEGVGLLSGCTKLDVTALIGINDLLNKQCQQNVACCQGTESTATGGLVNLALPCVALGSII